MDNRATTPAAEPAEERLARLVTVFKALTDLARLRILGALAERPRTGKELAKLLGLTPPTISHHLARLSEAGLVTSTAEAQRRVYRLDPEVLRRLAGAVPAAGPVAAAEDPVEQERAKTIRDFFDGPRLRQIPAQRRKRIFVLQHLLARFDPERDYPEKEVNAILREAHEDVATLRRELVDYGFMTREGGVYRDARQLPARGPTVAQEIAGDENAWLRAVLERALAESGAGEGGPGGGDEGGDLG